MWHWWSLFRKWHLHHNPCPCWHQAQFPAVIWECFLELWSCVTLSNEVQKWWCRSQISAWFLTPAVQLIKCKSRTITHSESKNYPLGNALDSSICALILCAVCAHWGTRGIAGAVSSCNNASRIIWSNGQANNTWENPTQGSHSCLPEWRECAWWRRARD